MTNVKKLKQDTPEPKATQHNLTITLDQYIFPKDFKGDNQEEYDNLQHKKLEFENIRGFQVGVNVMQILKADGTTFLIPVSRIYEVQDSFKEVE